MSRDRLVVYQKCREEGTFNKVTFADLSENSDGEVTNVGEVVPGTVIAMTNDYVVVDIGDKSESDIHCSEFKNENGEIEVKVGDVFDVFVEKREAEGGLKLSREKAIGIKVWEDIAKIQEADGTISGRIDNRVKGGLSVDIGVPAFLPYSQIDLRPVKDLDSLIGQTFEFKVLKYNRKRNNVVISRRAILEDERKKLREDMQSNLVEGQVVTGTITNITDYGIFIDLGGMDGLCHVKDLSWGRLSHPSKLFKVGEEIEAKVLKYDKETDKVSLGVKQLKEDPWQTVQERYSVGSKITGKVVSITVYGIFAEIEEGVEGLIHISDISWSNKINHPSKIFKIGASVEAQILSIDVNAKRISLGKKQLNPVTQKTAEEFPENVPWSLIFNDQFGEKHIDNSLLKLDDRICVKQVGKIQDLIEEQDNVSISHVIDCLNKYYPECPIIHKVCTHGKRISLRIDNVIDMGSLMEILNSICLKHFDLPFLTDNKVALSTDNIGVLCLYMKSGALRSFGDNYEIHDASLSVKAHELDLFDPDDSEMTIDSKNLVNNIFLECLVFGVAL